MQEPPTADPSLASDKSRRPTRDEILRDIERAMPREPYDRVKCVHLFGTCFRCNWWAPSPTGPEQNKSFDWATRATHYIRQSRFLHVTVNNGKLVIEEADLSAAAPA